MDPVETSVLTLEQLPDDVLVMVLQYVSVEDVLACRLVCKRFCGLAVHRDVWRHRSLSDDHPRAGAVLRLAPCLDTLTVSGQVPTMAATSTKCAAARLNLWAEEEEHFNAAEYATAVRNQESYGRLRSLELLCSNLGSKATNAELLRTVVSCSDLESLEVFGQLPKTSNPVLHGPPRPSLKNFQCGVNEYSLSFVHTILAAHAATLEKVDFAPGFCIKAIKETATAALLAALPRLQRLRCNDSIGGLAAVAACRTLRDVCIRLGHTKAGVKAVAKFFRRANQLRRVYLPFGEGNAIAALVDALASPPWQSQLERLSLGWLEDMGPLVRALPALPALRHLDFSEVTPDADKLLLSITPATAPALRRLEFRGLSWCPHPWIHKAEVKATLAANTSLHILLGYYPQHVPQCVRRNCEACLAVWHQQVYLPERGRFRKIGLFAHDHDECPSPDVHTAHSHSDNEWNREGSLEFECTWIHV